MCCYRQRLIHVSEFFYFCALTPKTLTVPKAVETINQCLPLITVLFGNCYAGVILDLCDSSVCVIVCVSECATLCHTACSLPGGYIQSICLIFKKSTERPKMDGTTEEKGVAYLHLYWPHQVCNSVQQLRLNDFNDAFRRRLWLLSLSFSHRLYRCNI